MTLLRVILSGKRTPGERKERVAGSVAQDICYSVTNGAWKQPKHIGLANAVRHWTGKAELISLLNHFGHCVSHGSSLALENNIFRNILQTRSVLPPTFSRTQNKVLHLAWDNFDLCEETPSGSGTTHSTHGIAIQEQSEDGHACATKQEQLLIEDIGEKLLAATKDLPPCYANQKAEPLLHVTKTSISKPDALCNAAKSDLLWILSRRKFRDEQQIPGWSGFVSMTGHKTEEKNLPQKSVMDYLQPVLHPVTENSTVQHILEISMAATKEVNQEYTLVTSDLAVAKKAYMLVWQTEKFKKIIVRHGVFHLVCSYMGAVGKLMRGSGFEEFAIQSGVRATGSVEGVLQGKHYNRCMMVHKTMLEGLERLFLQKFLQDRPEAKHVMDKVTENLDYPSHENHQVTLQEECTSQLFNMFANYRKSVLNGKMGKTAQFWLMYAERIWIVLRLLRATKQNDLELHIASVGEMLPVLHAANHQHYARYASVYFLSMLNLEDNYPGAEKLLRDGGFSVSRSTVPASRVSVDQALEQSVNREAKGKCGIIGFSRKVTAYILSFS